MLSSVWGELTSHAMRLYSVWPINLQYQSEAAAYRLQLCNGSV